MLAAGGISAALAPNDVAVTGNVISAGHLRLAINHGENADFHFDNMAPGESRTAYQLVTADMAGIAAATLSMTLSGAGDTPFTRHSSLAVAYSDPAADSSLSTAGDCETASYPSGHAQVYTPLADLSTNHDLALGTLTDSATAVCVRLTVTLDQSAGNPVQGKSGGFSMDYTLTQTASAQAAGGGTP